MKILLMSFGYKQGIPLKADLVFDVRFLNNPFYVDALKTKTGHSPAVKYFITRQASCQEYLYRIENLLTFLIHEYKKNQRSCLTIAFGCTGGRHRSVVIAEAIKKFLKRKKIPVSVMHRDEKIQNSKVKNQK